MLAFKYGRYVTSSAPTATPDLSWTTTVTATGVPEDIWHAELMGFKVSYTVQTGDTTTDVADGLAAAIDALPGITSTNAANVITTTRTVAPTLEIDSVSHLVIRVEGGNPGGLPWEQQGQPGDGGRAGGPYPRPSNATWTNVVATEAAVSLAEFGVYHSVPNA